MFPFRDFISSRAAKNPHYLVVGHPISHSLSPLMHRVALDYFEINAGYHAVDLEEADLDLFISWINRDQFLGANVTIPYKQFMVQVVDYPDETVQALGAMNTIVKRENGVYGFNTDVKGFSQPLFKFKNQLVGGSALLFGTGGAARAVLSSLRQFGVNHIYIVSRNPGEDNPLFEFDDVTACSYQDWQAYSDEIVLVINSTPLGMSPSVETSPVSEKEGSLLKNKICYDLVYNPVKTKFLQFAEQAGATMISGLDMFIEQGSESFRLWTGHSFPVEEVTRALKPVLR